MKKKLLFLLIFIIYITNFTFAATSIWHDLYVNIFAILDVITSIWYIFPILAWKLLSNDFVYWTFMHLDVILWKIWNFSRTIANFAIWFIFIYSIFKYLVYQTDKSWWILKSTLPKLAVWAILVNMSWFIIWVLVDLSIILVAAFGSLPAMFTQTKNYPQNYTVPKELTLEHVQKKTSDLEAYNWPTLKVQENMDISSKDLISYETTISWPLYFIWSTLININKVREDFRETAINNDTKKLTLSWWAAIKLMAQVLILVLFIVPIIVLIIVNIVRLFWIWVYIWFSPFIFLDSLFWWKVLWSSNKALAIKNVIWLIFQPAIVVLAFSVWFIFLSVMFSLFIQNKDTDDSKKLEHILNIKTDKWVVVIWNNFQLADVNSSFSKYLWWFAGYTIITLLSLIFVWSLIKLSFKASEVTSWIAESTMWFTEDLMKTAPIFPKHQSIWSLEKAWEHISGIPNTMKSKQAWKLEKIFDTVLDIDKTKIQKYETYLKDWNMTEENLSDIYSDLKKYSWKENLIETNKNARKLLDDLVNKIITYNWSDKDVQKFITNLSKITDEKKKLTTVLNNWSKVKDILLPGN